MTFVAHKQRACMSVSKKKKMAPRISGSSNSKYRAHQHQQQQPGSNNNALASVS